MNYLSYCDNDGYIHSKCVGIGQIGKLVKVHMWGSSTYVDPEVDRCAVSNDTSTFNIKAT